eukprot:TRINITY_DN55357_c0_g1_i1.p1 TRINITY_DN55357_c0_g1~~TRINITY_DN55357_c0_g1_i1.p1  ORF type:complete len:683 (+),score=98.14 TRINITY_DN55357_c0_g1_i1:116-2050(+)
MAPGGGRQRGRRGAQSATATRALASAFPAAASAEAAAAWPEECISDFSGDEGDQDASRFGADGSAKDAKPPAVLLASGDVSFRDWVRDGLGRVAEAAEAAATPLRTPRKPAPARRRCGSRPVATPVRREDLASTGRRGRRGRRSAGEPAQAVCAIPGTQGAFVKASAEESLRAAAGTAFHGNAREAVQLPTPATYSDSAIRIIPNDVDTRGHVENGFVRQAALQTVQAFEVSNLAARTYSNVNGIQANEGSRSDHGQAGSLAVPHPALSATSVATFTSSGVEDESNRKLRCESRAVIEPQHVAQHVQATVVPKNTKGSTPFLSKFLDGQDSCVQSNEKGLRDEMRTVRSVELKDDSMQKRPLDIPFSNTSASMASSRTEAKGFFPAGSGELFRSTKSMLGSLGTSAPHVVQPIFSSNADKERALDAPVQCSIQPPVESKPQLLCAAAQAGESSTLTRSRAGTRPKSTALSHKPAVLESKPQWLFAAAEAGMFSPVARSDAATRPTSNPQSVAPPGSALEPVQNTNMIAARKSSSDIERPTRSAPAVQIPGERSNVTPGRVAQVPATSVRKSPMLILAKPDKLSVTRDVKPPRKEAGAGETSASIVRAGVRRPLEEPQASQASQNTKRARVCAGQALQQLFAKRF